MKLKLLLPVFLILLFATPQISAEVVCGKVKVRQRPNGKLRAKLLSKTVATGERCGRGYKPLLDTDSLAGVSVAGPKGEKGEQGSQGVAGEPGKNGTFGVYGDGSAGDLVIDGDEVIDHENPQFRDIKVEQGATLTVFSVAPLRCSGKLTNNGTIKVVGRSGAMNSISGQPVPPHIAKSFFNLGFRSPEAGSVSIFCKDGIVNNGRIEANGPNGAGNSNAGGFVILASSGFINNVGLVQANGGSGKPCTQYQGAVGGGGGGIIRLVAPSINSTGVIEVIGGPGVPSGSGAGALAGSGFEGGAFGGLGGEGGQIDEEVGTCFSSEDGHEGQVYKTLADPASLLLW